MRNKMKRIYLLDTNIISEPVKKVPDESVLIELEARTKLSAISVISWSELLQGVQLMPEGKRQRRIESFIINDINALYDKVPFDEHAAFIYSKLYSDYKKNGVQPPIHDLQIAATAIANNMILVTRNTKDFENIPGIMLENWFSEN